MRLRDKTCLHAALHDGHFMSANVSPNIPMPRPLSGGRCGEYVPAMPRRRVSSVSKGISGAGRARDGARRMRRGWRKKDARTRLRARFQCGTAAITTRDAVGQRIETPEDGGFHMIVNRPTATSQTAHGHGAASWLGGGVPLLGLASRGKFQGAGKAESLAYGSSMATFRERRCNFCNGL